MGQYQNAPGASQADFDALNSKLSYKAGDSVTFKNPTCFAGRLGWGRTRIIFSIPLDRKVENFTSVTVAGKLGIYVGDTLTLCTAAFNSAYTASNNILNLRFDITPDTTWLVTSDGSAIVELNGDMVINF